MPIHESDVCVIGGGITAAMLIERLAELKPGLRITVIEAGRSIFDRENRGTYHRRALEYGEHPWHDDYIEDQQAKGMISMTMAVGGQALHWGGACNRFSEEDLRLKSLYGLSDDWPLEWNELERFYVEAERRLNVAGDPSPVSRRSPLWSLSAAGDAALVQPAGSEEVGGAERLEILAAAAVAQHRQALRRPRRVRPLRHLRRCVPDRRALFSRLHLSTADRGEESDAARSHAGPKARARGRPRHHRGGAGVSPGPSERDHGISCADVRPRVRPVLEPAPVAALRELAVPQRHRQSLRAGRALHERPQVHLRPGDDRRADVPRPEHDAQPDFARALPLRDQQAVCSPRHARLGKLGRQGTAAARRRRTPVTRRRAAR